jgi:hypothetical protein
MRRGETAKIMWFLRDYTDACVLFRHYTRLISAKAQGDASEDPHAPEILSICDRIEKTTTARIDAEVKAATAGMEPTPLPLTTRVLFLVISLMYAAYAFRTDTARDVFGIPDRDHLTIVDLVNIFIAVVLVLYSSISVMSKLGSDM